MILTNPDFACRFWDEALRNAENNQSVQEEERIEFYRK